MSDTNYTNYTKNPEYTVMYEAESELLHILKYTSQFFKSTQVIQYCEMVQVRINLKSWVKKGGYET